MRRRIRSYRDLEVWQRAVDLTVEVYEISRQFPVEERFVLTTQARRAALSIPANIAEGHGRSTRQEYRRFVNIARGSLNELVTCLIVAVRLGYVAIQQLRRFRELINQVGRMLNALRRALKTSKIAR